MPKKSAAMPKKSAAMLELLEVVEKAALAENPSNDGVSRTGGNAAQKRRAEDEGGAGAAGRRTSDADDEDEAMASAKPSKAAPKMSRRTGNEVLWTMEGTQAVAEEAGEHNGKVLPPKRNYEKIQDATGETKAEQDAVRAMVLKEWALTRDAEEQHDECVRHTAVALSGAIFAAAQKTGKNLTKEGIVTAVVRCVPNKKAMLDHFEMVGVPAGHVQVGLWYNMQTYAALMQSLIELGLATGKTDREAGSVFMFEEYTFCESFWLDLLPRLYGVGSTDRTMRRSSTCFPNASSVYDARNTLGYQNDKQAAQPAATAEMPRVDRKVFSLRALTCKLCRNAQNSNRHRFVDDRTQRRDDAAERVGPDRLNVINPGSRKQVVLPDACVKQANRWKRQRKADENEKALLRATVVLLTSALSYVAGVSVSAVLANLPAQPNVPGPSNGAGAAGK